MRGLCLFVCFIALAYKAVGEAADDGKLLSLDKIDWKIEQTRFKGSASFEGGFVVGNSHSAGGYGVGTAIQYGITEKWGVGMGLRQSFYLGGVSPMFTMLDMKAVYSLSPSLILEKTTVSVSGSRVTSSYSKRRAGYQLQGSFSQFFFSADSAVVQLTGLGAGLVYDFEPIGPLNYQVGCRADFIFNRIFVFVPFQVFFGISYWL